MNNFICGLEVIRFNKRRDERVRKLCGVIKGMNKRVKNIVFRWLGHIERMDINNLII